MLLKNNKLLIGKIRYSPAPTSGVMAFTTLRQIVSTSEMGPRQQMITRPLYLARRASCMYLCLCSRYNNERNVRSLRGMRLRSKSPAICHNFIYSKCAKSGKRNTYVHLKAESFFLRTLPFDGILRNLGDIFFFF